MHTSIIQVRGKEYKVANGIQNKYILIIVHTKNSNRKALKKHCLTITNQQINKMQIING